MALLLGCQTNSAPTAPDADFFVVQGTAFLLRVGDTAGVQTPNAIVLVNFADVLGDNRCPVDVNCVDAGQASVQLSVQTALAVQDVLVEVPPDGTASVTVEEVGIEVLRLRPEARAGVTISLLDYEIGLVVRQTGDLGVPQ